MQGREHTMIERYLPGGVQRQFRELQDRPDDGYVVVFACSMAQVSWGHGIPASKAIESFRNLVARLWAYDQGLADPGTSQAYRDWF